MSVVFEAAQARTSEHPVDKLFLDRWSPRSFSGAEIPQKELMSLFEAAKWAPSSFNGQPWRLLYARRATPAWTSFFNLLGDFNQSWCKNAAALVLFVSRMTFEHNGKPARTHSFDTGAAWMSLALQAHKKGYIAHGMEGFDYDRAKKDLTIPDGYQVEAMVAIGVLDDAEKLPDALKKMEKPNDRRPLAQSVCEGAFRF